MIEMPRPPISSEDRNAFGPEDLPEFFHKIIRRPVFEAQHGNMLFGKEGTIQESYELYSGSHILPLTSDHQKVRILDLGDAHPQLLLRALDQADHILHPLTQMP